MTKEILEKIIERFGLEEFKKFFAFKNHKFRPSNDDLQYFVKGSESFQNGQKLGELSLEDGNLLVSAFHFTKELSERSGKKAQYNLGKRILRDTNFRRFNAGIFIFYDAKGNFRFSLIYDIPKANGRRDWSNFKRFTYFVSPEQTNKTFLKQIGEGDFSTLEKIEEAFSVERVTKEFFKRLSDWYAWALDNVQFPKDAEKEKKDQQGRKIALIRFLTRIIFIWFMRQKKLSPDSQKSLIPDYLFSENKLQDILKDFNPQGEESSYYKAILQNLFFATLNTPKDKRRFTIEKRGRKGVNSDYGNHNVCRYHELFKDPDNIKRYFNAIPFLNGGLFECLDIKAKKEEDRYYIDGFTRTKKYQPIFPNFLFFSLEKRNNEQINKSLNKYYGTKNKKYQVEGLINILKRYNFTIDENSPVDVDIALDPELLGRIFENLLASYNPETATTARKATGSYYTPREIVHYMVDESLKAYFKTKLGDIRDIDQKLEGLFSYETDENSFNEEETRKLVKAIDEIRVIDPAVGSGAFPMGILQRLVFLLSKLDPDNKIWRELQKEKILEKFSGALDIKDKQERERALKEIDNTFERNTSDYGRKLYLIKNCIYGVDIQPIAIQITKLRFFISLLVDMKVDKSKDNFGIDPLPNLETKFVAANSLIGLDNKKQLSFKDPQLKKLEDDLKKVKDLYFDTSDIRGKTKLRKRDRNIRKKVGKLLEESGFAPDSTKKIVSWDPYNPNKSADWFDPEWMFGVKNGFDIVITNPPYIDYRKIDKDTKDALSKFYSYQKSKTGNIFIYFVELGIGLLNKNGIATYINPYRYLTANFAIGLREFLIQNSSIMRIVNVSNIKVFEASVYTSINFFKKVKTKQNQIEIIQCHQLEDLRKSGYKISQDSISANDQYLISVNPCIKLLDRIEDSARRLSDLCRIFCGTSSGGFSKAIIGTCQYSQLSVEEQNDYCIIKRSSDIRRYHIINSKISYIHKRIYPVNTLQDFHKPKIFFARMTRWIRCAYSEDNYCAGKVNVLVDFQESPQYLLALLNSKLLNFWYSNKFESKHLSGGYLGFDIPSVKLIPIKIASKDNQRKIINLVNKILAITKDTDYLENKTKQEHVAECEKQIDQLVYKLYNLTPEEIKIVENYNNNVSN